MERSGVLILLLALGVAMGACGADSGPVGPSIAATPPPQPSPSPSTTPPSCEHGSCGNNTAVARVVLRIYMMFNEKGEPVPVPDPTKGVVHEPIPVGYRFRLDVTGRDANGHETDGRGQIHWEYTGQDLVHTDARSPWQRDITVAAPGKWSAYVIFDGVGSNDLSFTFVAR